MSDSSPLEDATSLDRILREIDALVANAIRPEGDARNAAGDGDSVEMEALAQDLGISIDALRALRETALG